MTSRERFIGACACRPLNRPPVWIMRQAGRYLPEYRELKARHDFRTLVKTPALAAEATLQPLKRFPIDAAILFSDILVVPEALGQGYRFGDEGGISMEYRLDSRARIGALGAAEEVPARASYVADALGLLKKELAGTKALLGFAGSPWTLACYMVEGGSSVDFARIKGLFNGERATFDLLMEKLTAAIAAYLRMQIQAGADAVQIFDSWGGVVAGPDYEAASLQWIRRIIEQLPCGVPVILFAKGTAPHFAAQVAAGAAVLSVDWTVDLPSVHTLINARSPAAVQGNLDPALLSGAPDTVRRETERLLASMRGRNGHIFNLGHGILPDAKIPCVEAMVDTVVNWR